MSWQVFFSVSAAKTGARASPTPGVDSERLEQVLGCGETMAWYCLDTLASVGIVTVAYCKLVDIDDTRDTVCGLSNLRFVPQASDNGVQTCGLVAYGAAEASNAAAVAAVSN